MRVQSKNVVVVKRLTFRDVAGSIYIFLSFIGTSYREAVENLKCTTQATYLYKFRKIWVWQMSHAAFIIIINASSYFIQFLFVFAYY